MALTASEEIELDRMKRRLKGDDLTGHDEFYRPAPDHLRRIVEARIRELESKR